LGFDAGREAAAVAAGFPTYTAAEAAADRFIHLLGVPAAIVSACWLVARVSPAASAKLTFTLLVYSFGLIGMLAVSAAYNLSSPSRVKERLRRADHAMIFVMIAGSYTPFALNVLPRGEGLLLCAAVWFLAAVGIGAKLLFPRRLERVSLVLYLGMGWIALSMIGSFVALLPREVLWLLLLGGIAYSLGALLHSLRRVPFHNAAWHALVLVGAGLHLAAMAAQFARPA